MQQVQYDVVLSCAQEDEEVAGQIAIRLQEKGITVYYDKLKEAEKWGKNSVDFDNEIFGNAGKYCIVLLSSHFAKDDMTNLQRQIIQNKAIQQKDEYILPVRIDDTPVAGFLKSVACVSYQKNGADGIALLVSQKLGIKGPGIFSNLKSLFATKQEKKFVNFELQSDENFENPFMFNVAAANDKIMQLAGCRDIRIVGCEVMPHRIQLQASNDKYELIRGLFLSRKLKEMTGIRWTKISQPDGNSRLRAPKQSPLIISSQYEEKEFDSAGRTVVCHAANIENFLALATMATRFIGKDTTADIRSCQIFICNDKGVLYVHSNFKKPGCDFSTKIATNQKVSLFTILINLVYLEWPDEMDLLVLADLHKNVIPYYMLEASDTLEESFFSGATNIEFVSW